MFENLAAGLGDAWWVLHSVGLVRHATKRWAEADFVLVGPGGVYVLEVKGGRVDRNGGIWTITDRNGRVDRPAEGPFDQAGGAAGALQLELAKTLRRADGCRVQVGYGVVLPDCELTAEGPDLERRILLDASPPLQSYTEFVEQLTTYWSGRLGPVHLTGADVDAVVAAVRPDFESRSSLRRVLDEVQEDQFRLTEQQARTQLELATTPRMLVEGGAGTGKTHLAVGDALAMARSGRRVLYACHTRALAHRLLQMHGEVPNLRIATWSSVMWDLVESAGLADRIPDDIDEESKWRAIIPQLAVEAAEQRNAPWDVVVVDEGQDLLREQSLRLLDHLLADGLERGSWRWFMDPHQDVFGDRGHGLAVALRSAAGSVRRLSVNCRNTTEIADAVHLLSGRSADTAEVHGPEVRWHHHDHSEGFGLVRPLRELLDEGVPSSAITVLTPGPIADRERERLSDGAGIQLVSLEWTLQGRERLTGVDSDEAVRCSSIQAFKGLESAVVLLAGMERLTSKQTRRMAYVGASRPTTMLAVSLHSSENEYLTQLSIEFAERQSEPCRTRESSWLS